TAFSSSRRFPGQEYENIQPVIKVFPKGTALHFEIQILVRGSNQTHVHLPVHSPAAKRTRAAARRPYRTMVGTAVTGTIPVGNTLSPTSAFRTEDLPRLN